MSPRPKVALELRDILEAAGELADHQGLQEVTLASLAKKLNIRPPSLYNHFAGLPGLKKQLAIYGLEKLYEALAKAAIGVSGKEEIPAVSRAYIQFARRHPGLYEATLFAPDPEDEDIEQAGSRIVELAVKMLTAVQLEGDLRLHAVRGLRSILHGLSTLEQRGGFKMALDFDETLEIVIRSFITGIEQESKRNIE